MSTASDLTPEELAAYSQEKREEEIRMDQRIAALAGLLKTPPPTQADRVEQKVDALTALVQHLVDSLAGDDDGDEPPAKTLDGDLDGGERDQSQAL